jgi:hypothetical protein
MSLDAEVLADLKDFSARKVRAIVREQPLASVAGALAVGFIVGGGWRTRIGRLMALAAARHVALKAAEHYFNA